ncbi:MAG: hypothetical protein HUK20_00235 [Fibrobacter sp.]|nr:hypothetical protein [Fibrobacter sp.]
MVEFDEYKGASYWEDQRRWEMERQARYESKKELVLGLVAIAGIAAIAAIFWAV